MESKETILQELKSIYGHNIVTIGKSELGEILGVKETTISMYLTKGYALPKCMKFGSGGKCSSVRFLLNDVAEFLLNIKYKNFNQKDA